MTSFNSKQIENKRDVLPPGTILRCIAPFSEEGYLLPIKPETLVWILSSHQFFDERNCYIVYGIHLIVPMALYEDQLKYFEIWKGDNEKIY